MKHREGRAFISTIFLEKFWRENPVLIKGLALTPVIAAASTLKAGVVLAVVLAVITIPTSILMNLVGKKSTEWLRPVMAAVLSGLLLIPCMLVLKQIAPNIILQLGVFLPILIINSLTVYEAAEYAPDRSLVQTSISSVAGTLGIAAVIVIIAAAREMLGNAEIGGVYLPWSNKAPILSTPFGGLIFLAFLSAGLRGIFLFIKGRKVHKAVNSIPDTDQKACKEKSDQINKNKVNMITETTKDISGEKDSNDTGNHISDIEPVWDDKNPDCENSSHAESQVDEEEAQS